MQNIFNREAEDLEKSFLDLAPQVKEDYVFKHEIMLSLFFSINMREVECARTILAIETEMISKIFVSLRKHGEQIMKKRSEKLKQKRHK